MLCVMAFASCSPSPSHADNPVTVSDRDEDVLVHELAKLGELVGLAGGGHMGAIGGPSVWAGRPIGCPPSRRQGRSTSKCQQAMLSDRRSKPSQRLDASWVETSSRPRRRFVALSAPGFWT